MIELINVSKSFKKQNKEMFIFKNLNIAFKANTIVLITGESGSGKSTLLDIISLNDTNHQGNLSFNKTLVDFKNINNIKRKVVFLNQGQTMFLDLKPYENTSLINYKASFGLFAVIMKNFGLDKVINKKTGLLSGGERQRVGIVRSLSKRCDLLVMDEPTSSLDNQNKNYFISEVIKHKYNKTIIIATHDKDLYKIADQIIKLENGKIHELKSNGELVKSSFNNQADNFNNLFYLLTLDITNNKRRLLIFISALSNGLLGLLLGVIIVSGFEGFFVNLLITQVPSNQSIAYKKDMTKFDYNDLDNFNHYIVCNSDYEIYCDENSGNVYVGLEINNSKEVVRLNDSDFLYVSSSVYKTLDSNQLNISHFDQPLFVNEIPKVIEGEIVEIGLPYKLIMTNLKQKVGKSILGDYIIFDHSVQLFALISNYRLVNVFQDYFKAFKEILDWVMIGFIGYSSVSLLLGIISVSVLLMLDIESKRKHIGTLLLLGWSQLEVKLWIILSSLIKASLTSFITIFTLVFSINSLNNIVKDATNLEIVFNFPDLRLIVVLIISLHLIVGSIAFFHIKNLLKLTPKQLINNK